MADDDLHPVDEVDDDDAELDDPDDESADDQPLDDDASEDYDDESDESDDELEDDERLEDDEELEADDETDFATIASGATIEEAKRAALRQLRKLVPSLDEADVEFVVVEEGSKGGFFGRGRSEARVEARVVPSGARRPEAEVTESAEVLREFIQTTVDLMGITATVDAAEAEDVVRANVSGDDLGLLIGRHGATIDALQYIAAIVVNGDRHNRRQVVVDAEGYRERREAALKALADRVAQKVARESAPVTLKPMSAAERKVVHLHLKDHPRVETASEGQEPFRAVVISPRRRG